MTQGFMLEAGQQAASAASFDWSQTRLGARARWPHALRVAVDIVLDAPLPMLLVWGGERIVVFNQAYAALAGPAHARPPGASVPPIWPAPLAAGRDAFERALAGEAAQQPRQRLALVREHGLEPLEYDLSFTPVRDQHQQVRGVLCALEPSRPAPDPGRLRILVVEDNLDSQYLVCEMLKAFGHQADGVAHGEEALAMLGQAHYQVLFSDVSLPGISGVELARQALAAQPGLHVIFASGYGEALLRHVDFGYISLQKPYDIEQLQAALASIDRQLQVKT
jgi:CheY-like chemotaxis protein